MVLWTKISPSWLDERDILIWWYGLWFQPAFIILHKDKEQIYSEKHSIFLDLGKISFSVLVRTSLELNTSTAGENDHLERHAADSVLGIINHKVQSTRSEFLFWSRKKEGYQQRCKKLVIDWQSSGSHIASCDCFPEGQEGLSQPYFSSP